MLVKFSYQTQKLTSRRVAQADGSKLNSKTTLIVAIFIIKVLFSEGRNYRKQAINGGSMMHVADESCGVWNEM